MAHRLVSALCNVSLFPHQGMRDTQVDLRGQVAPQLLTERAVHHDGLKRERRYASRNLTTGATPARQTPITRTAITRIGGQTTGTGFTRRKGRSLGLKPEMTPTAFGQPGMEFVPSHSERFRGRGARLGLAAQESMALRSSGATICALFCPRLRQPVMPPVLTAI